MHGKLSADKNSSMQFFKNKQIHNHNTETRFLNLWARTQVPECDPLAFFCATQCMGEINGDGL